MIMIAAWFAGAFGALAFLASWVGFAVLVLYLFIVSAIFKEDWWIRGFLFLAVPIGIAFGIGVIGVPSWAQAAWILGGYFVSGVIWSGFRWAIFVSDLRKVLEKIIASPHKPTRWLDLPPSDKGSWIWGQLDREKDYSNYYFSRHLDIDAAKYQANFVPNVSSWECKARLGSWILYWPFSALNYAYMRLLKDFVDFLIERLKGVYNAIATSIMSGLEI